MQRIRDIAFTAIVGLVLFAAIGNVAAAKLLPGYDIPEHSTLEGREYQHFPDIGAQTLLNHNFQNDFEQYVADRMLGRNTLLLANAKLQRTGIESANLLFRYPAYPTFYGGTNIVIPEYDATLNQPEEANAARRDELARCAEALGGMAQRHPDVSWYLAMPDRAETTMALPSHDLVATPADYQYYRKNFFKKLPEAFNIIDLGQKKAGSWFSKYYHTDHHWRIQGAIEAYDKVMKAMGRTPVEHTFFEAYAGPFYGSFARTGLCDINSDSIDDVAYEHDPLTVYVNGEQVEESFLNTSLAPDFEKFVKSGKFDNAYGDYFHRDYGIIQIVNENADTDDTLVIIGDSFTNPIERVFAESFRTVFVVDPRQFERDGQAAAGWDIDDFIEQNDVDSVLFCCWGRFYLDTNIALLDPS